jgi:hypothetical protein
MFTIKTASNKKCYKFSAQAIKQSSPPGRASRAGLFVCFFLYQDKKETKLYQKKLL